MLNDEIKKKLKKNYLNQSGLTFHTHNHNYEIKITPYKTN
jgi:hypothetical protein